MPARKSIEDKLKAAALLAQPGFNCARGMAAFSPDDPDALDVAYMMLQAVGEQAVRGDMQDHIRLLSAQVRALDFVMAAALSNAARATGSTAALLLRVATQAQEQCRRTVETMRDLQSPRAVIGQQVNVQVNAELASPATPATLRHSTPPAAALAPALARGRSPVDVQALPVPPRGELPTPLGSAAPTIPAPPPAAASIAEDRSQKVEIAANGGAKDGLRYLPGVGWVW